MNPSIHDYVCVCMCRHTCVHTLSRYKPGMMVNAYNSSIKEVVTSRSLELSDQLAWPIAELQTNGRLGFKKNQDGSRETVSEVALWSPHEWAHAYTHVNTHPDAYMHTQSVGNAQRFRNRSSVEHLSIAGSECSARSLTCIISLCRFQPSEGRGLQSHSCWTLKS